MAKLTVNENPQGFTDEITISFEDFSVANAGTLADRATKTFTYVIPAGSLVTKASAKLVNNDSCICNCASHSRFANLNVDGSSTASC